VEKESDVGLRVEDVADVQRVFDPSVDPPLRFHMLVFPAAQFEEAECFEEGCF